MDMPSLIQQQRDFFKSGKTRSLDFRLTQLNKLKSVLITHQDDIIEALALDLHRSEMESFLSEVILVLDELDFIIKHLKNWMKPTKVHTPLPLLWPGKSRLYHEPYGVALVIGAWNYPFMLMLSPVIGALCAGNCVVMKPSELAVHMQAVLSKIISENFDESYFAVVTGGQQEAAHLLKEKWDYIFFTGSTRVGKIVMEAAATHLTPVTLELGGKSPCIVDASANLDFAARRIARAKTMNAGQICIAPDYLFVERSCKVAFIKKLKYYLQQFYGTDPKQSDSYARIINKNHFDRLTSYLNQGTILHGGDTDAAERYIAPTLIDDLTWDDSLMKEEIFGPLLPIFTFDHLDDVINTVNAHPKPLSLYLFTTNKQHQKEILERISFGGGCINDCLLQIANPHLPFGGVGQSGMGQYHGKYSFETFSHQKSIYKKSWSFDMPLEYPPYHAKKLGWIKRILSFF